MTNLALINLLLHHVNALGLVALLDEHLADETAIERESVDPVRAFGRRHVIHRDHVSVGHEHVRREVQDLRVELKVVGYPSMEHLIPCLIRILLNFGRVERYPVSPKMTDLARFKNQIVSLTFVLQVVAIFDKPDIELVEVGLYVNALQLRIHVLIDEHEVRVDFKAAVFTHSDTNLIFLAFWVSFGH